jgi:5-formyltetrahydrofolate cyclo-ligase
MINMPPAKPLPEHAPEQTKAQLRATLRQRRRKLNAACRARAAESAAAAVAALPDWPRRRRIALYLPADGEFETAAIAGRCRREARELYLPRVNASGHMTFSLWREEAQLSANRYGIPEPPPGAPNRSAGELDLIFLPLVGWDRHGTRLGMGGGYYDRALATTGCTGHPTSTPLRPLLVGLAYSVQETPRLPAQTWDIPLDFVLTERGLYRCQAADGQAPTPE